jgi:phenol hydroxylase P0 protein
MGQSRPGAALKKFVRVTGVRNGRFVEFEFSVNDSDLTVELILPLRAFDEFCALQEAVVLPSQAEAAAEFEHLAWRSKNPGLLRRVVRSETDDDIEQAPASRS